MMNINAYLRASTDEQNAQRAKGTIKDFLKSFNRRVSAFYIENASGSLLKRKELMRLLEESEKGDVLLVESIDRLTRLNQKGWETLSQTIKMKGIHIVSLDLPTSHMVFSSFPNDDFMNSILKAINNMLLDILAASAYKEYVERARKQKEGVLLAKKKNKYKGKPRDKEKEEQIQKLILSESLLNTEIAKIVGVSERKIYRVKAEMKEEGLL